MKSISPLAGFLQETLIQKVNKESDHDWALNYEIPQVPNWKAVKIETGRPGWVNFFRQALP